MAGKIEYLNGGLVTSTDPLMLEESQISDMRNCVYRSGSKALHRATGRTVFGTVSATADVNGLRDIRFDNGDHYLIAVASATLFSAPATGDTGTFGSFHTLTTAPTHLEIVHFRNRFFVLNGAAASQDGLNSNRVIYLSATGTGSAASTRQHGMLPVTDSPHVTTATGTFSQTITGYYEYWTTEVAKFSADGVLSEIESTFASSVPTTVFISATGQVPQIELPTIRNPGFTTHWRIYRSPKKDAEADKKFPAGFMIAEVSTATAIQADTNVTTATNFVFPGSFNTGADIFDDWSNASNLAADDGSEASVTGAALTVKSQGMYGFNFGGFSGSVRGIELVIGARVTANPPAPLSVRIGRRNTVNGGFRLDGPGGAKNGVVFNFKAPSKSFQVTATAEGAYTLGGANDRWIASDAIGFTDTDFGTDFMVVLAASDPSKVFAVDYVKAKAYYAATVDSVVQFPTVIYTFGDISAQVGKNGPPPVADTGDLFEDSLVMNDVNNRSLIRFSYPGDPDAFPQTYFIDFDTDENDQVRLVKVVNNRLVVALDSSIWRVNYLPSERDASFDRGKAKEPITRSYGCVGPMCAAVFSPTGDRELMAFVSHHGIHSTDGFSFETMTDALDWRTIISTSSTSAPIALVNDPEAEELLFYYQNDSLANETYMCLHISYASDHRTHISGPVHMRNFDSAAGGTFASLKSAWTLRRSTGAINTYLGYGGTSLAAGSGKVYRENGTTIPVQDPRMQFTTRDLALAGIGNEWRADQISFFVSSGTPDLAVTTKTQKTNDTNGLVTKGTVSRTLAGDRLVKMQLNQIGETQRYTVVASGQQDIAIQFMQIGGSDFGDEDSGR